MRAGCGWFQCGAECRPGINANAARNTLVDGAPEILCASLGTVCLLGRYDLRDGPFAPSSLTPSGSSRRASAPPSRGSLIFGRLLRLGRHDWGSGGGSTVSLVGQLVVVPLVVLAFVKRRYFRSILVVQPAEAAQPRAVSEHSRIDRMFDCLDGTPDR